MLIAVVDDDESVCRSLGRLFRSAGYDVTSFTEAAAFLAALHELRPACVLMDLEMPGMTGLELLDVLRGRPDPVPVVIVSGNDTTHNRRASADRGAMAFFPKPFDGDALLRAVADAVGAPPADKAA